MLGLKNEYDKEILEKLLKLTTENNEILIRLDKNQKRARLFQIIYWLFVLATLFGLFYYLKPIVDFLFANFKSIKDFLYEIPNIGNRFPEVNNLQNILNQIKQ